MKGLPIVHVKVEAFTEHEQLENNGYLVTGNSNYTLTYEHPERGNKEDIIKRHNEHKELCKKYWREHITAPKPYF